MDKQYALENKAVRQVLLTAMEKAVKDWRSKNKKYQAVINKQMLLDSDSSMDVTPAILQEMEKQSVTFAELPKARINPPGKAATSPATPAVKQPAKPTKQQAKPLINPPAKQALVQ